MVEGVRSGRIGAPAGLSRDSGRAGEGRFFVESAANTPVQKARLSTVPAIGLDSMLALQTIHEAMERDRAARKRGTAMIAALTDLQRAMLAAEDPALALRSLSELATGGPLADDPGLAAVLRAIVLRSRVEVARRTRLDPLGDA